MHTHDHSSQVTAERAGDLTPQVRLAYGLDQLADEMSVSRRYLYTLRQAGKLKVRKLGARSIVLGEDALAFLRSLPAA